MATNSGSDSKNTLYCSFCGKSQHEVRKLIAGPTVFICDECVELCMDIIREETKSSGLKSTDGVPTPREICKVLDDYVIGQIHDPLLQKPLDAVKHTIYLLCPSVLGGLEHAYQTGVDNCGGTARLTYDNISSDFFHQ